MKKIKLAILFFAISSMMLMVYYGCKKDDDNAEIFYGDSQTEEQNLIIDSCSVPTPSIDSIVDVNGIPFGNRKSKLKDGTIEKLVSDLIAFTHAKCKEKVITHHNESTPQHYGFAYSYGQRNMQNRLFPPAGNSLHSKDAVWGTDCSGLLINAIRAVGIPIENCNSVALPANLTFALALNDDYKNIIVEDKGQLSIWQIQSGDLILWPDVPHIGIVGRNLAGDVIIFQSNGTGTPEDEASQTKNWLSETRGVHPFSMIKMLTMSNGWPAPYKVYRFKEKDPSPSGFTITTKSISNITGNSAQSGGDITFSSQVAPNISARGVCWSTNTNPTINDYKINDGSGTGSFSSDISGLTSTTTYYVRAYAQSEGVVFYGNQISFQTSESGGEHNSIVTLTIDGATVTYDIVNALIFSNQIHIQIPYSSPLTYLNFYGGPWEKKSYNLNSPECSGNDLGEILLEHMGTPVIQYENSWMESCPSIIFPGTYVLMNKDNGNLTITSYDSTFVTSGGFNWKEIMIEGNFSAIMVDKSEVYPDYNFKNVSGSFLLYELRLNVDN